MYIYIKLYTYIYIYLSRGLGGVALVNREIVFVSFVRACERSCVCPWDDVVSEAGLRKLAACSGVPVPVHMPFRLSSQNHSLALRWFAANRC